MAETITERVQRGVALLDEQRPGWWRRVDVQTLNLASPCLCVLGQLYQHWARGLLDLFPGTLDEQMRAAARHGFAAMDELRVTAEWKRIIRARQETTHAR